MKPHFNGKQEGIIPGKQLVKILENKGKTQRDIKELPKQNGGLRNGENPKKHPSRGFLAKVKIPE